MISSEFEQQIVAVAEKTPYPAEAFFLMMNALQTPMQSTFVQTHSDAEQLCHRLRTEALRAYGSNAQKQLADWGIRSTKDFGVIIYTLIDKGLAQKSEQDSIEQFDNVFDFDEAFAERPRNTTVQYSLSLLFITTTIVAVFAAGFRTSGMHGGMVSVFSSWLALIGGCCVYVGIRDVSPVRHLLFITGFPFLVIGIVGFYLVVSREDLLGP